MERDDISPEIWRFIADKIDTVPHLEALLLLWSESDKIWTDAAIAAAVYVSQDQAAGILRDLAQYRLLRVEPGTPPIYSYDSSWDPGAELMPVLAETYRRHLIRVATFIHSKASSAVREFAKAFEIKKER